MRFNILVLALLSSAATAEAGSIDVITTGTDNAGSIEKISCGGCVKRVEKKAQSVVELAPGSQKVEIREVAGVKKVYRTEAWFGGSPVVFVSKALPDEAPALAENDTTADDDVASAPEADMIDESAKTAAVSADMGAATKVEAAPATRAFDPAKLELRVN